MSNRCHSQVKFFWQIATIVSTMPAEGALNADDQPGHALDTATNAEFDEELTYDHPDVVEAVFLFCLFWSTAAPMQLKDQIIVDNAIKSLSGLGAFDEGEGMPFIAPGK